MLAERGGAAWSARRAHKVYKMSGKIENLMNTNSEVQRRRRYKQMEMEQKTSEKLRKEGWEILSPTVVCDRIGIKNGKVFFIEFKKPGQKLRPFQEKVKQLVNDYLVVHY